MKQRFFAGVGVAAGVLGASALLIPAPAHADTADALIVPSAGALAESTTAMFLGGTFQPTPSLAFVGNAERLFLNPLDFAGPAANSLTICNIAGVDAPCDTALQVLTTPNLLQFGPSALMGRDIFIDAVENSYAEGGFDSDNPLTVFAYSQSAMALSAAYETLYDEGNGIPLDALKFVFIGNPSTEAGIAPNIYADLVQLFGGGSSGEEFTTSLFTITGQTQFLPGGELVGLTPNDLYDTTIYTIEGDGVAAWQDVWDETLISQPGNYLGALGNGLIAFFTNHVEYLGLTPEDIAAGVPTVDGTITTITLADSPDALLSLFTNGNADSGVFTALLGTIAALFDPDFY
ncbi:PE-PPE domain-containing protein [Candidatus Mycobacterium wuenschmannii]|uniref:PE-PPE domain-containing protein n=1 Tax=Candidatus Mycobacterium wuenschmannii TaxID=3027808 RepID=A0ABY8VQ85_9MYCO|nr:PE-PPE domain-containing protein [Candidatus Mycobacterium wuenschmannii]WIM85805.1 PE-PPE domain-containing protein [Candidatus Mycobacterium wuenschmannii]